MSLEELKQDSYDLIAAFPSKRNVNKPSIYVACLAAYNAGFLHGSWIDCTIGSDYVKEAIRDMLADSPEECAEEYAIHDYENFGSRKVDEWDNIDELCEIAELLDDEQGELILEIMDHLGSGTSIEAAKEFLEENYRGSHKDLGEYAFDLYEECGYAIPKELQYYINWDQVGADMETNGEIFTIESCGETHVFSNC